MGESSGVTIVLSVYNGRQFLPVLFDSIECQLGPSDEVLIYDDGSTDDSVTYLEDRGYKVLSSFDSPYFKLKSHGTQERITRNFFELARLATNDVIVLVDQDDIWMEGKLDLIRNNPGYDLYIHDAQVIDDQGNKILDSYQASLGGYTNSVLRNLMINRFLGCCMAFSKKTCFSFLPEIINDYYYHDQILGLILAKHNVLYDNNKLLSYRRHSNAVTSSGFKSNGKLKKRLLHRLQILQLIACVKSSSYK